MVEMASTLSSRTFLLIFWVCLYLMLFEQSMIVCNVLFETNE